MGNLVEEKGRGLGQVFGAKDKRSKGAPPLKTVFNSQKNLMSSRKDLAASRDSSEAPLLK